jgi:hypothetical protein
MRRWLLFLLAAVVIVLAGCALVGYFAVQQAPEFYERELAIDRSQQQAASNEMFNRTQKLKQETKRVGKWEAVFTADQINGFLAVDLEKHYPLPPGAIDPRVDINDGELIVACRYDGSGIPTVLWLALEVFLSGPNELAVRVRKARAGAMPIPIGEVVHKVSKAAEENELPLVWRQADGDPVAILRLPEDVDPGRRATLDRLELREGAIYVGGRTERE